MPDIGGMELLVIGIVALIVVGPKDLPAMFKKLGQMVARVRAMGREFTNAMNAAADETGMTEMSRDLRAASKFTNPKAMAKDMMGDVMDDIDPSKYEEGSATRVIAEKKATAQAEAKAHAAKAREARAAKAAEAAELSGEPEEVPAAAEAPAAAADPVTTDPGPADVEAPAEAEPQASRP
ncbi:twin arginine-targeting protein translocase TatB [Jannaschia sp. EhC01]|nr:twin arginine-targeting protein translocase TatB [Jannaschia sp. EhC01]